MAFRIRGIAFVTASLHSPAPRRLTSRPAPRGYFFAAIPMPVTPGHRYMCNLRGYGVLRSPGSTPLSRHYWSYVPIGERVYNLVDRVWKKGGMRLPVRGAGADAADAQDKSFGADALRRECSFQRVAHVFRVAFAVYKGEDGRPGPAEAGAQRSG